ncbi:S-adenosyl-L-methionine (SAM)-dependent methyltransferase PhcB [Salmonella enterica subsp. arizonae]|uniref:S-adenosyl-L-methionine (SAM)-dependent methyltransferase PhcB n=1 Tax=Salmonella enterica subsp. arizonae TaxID=59203 RepID=A0A379SZ52_SALER|nr:S-adenosyl-L-methionine (SAM)-dependent methyltransferase PhcB [Salmonella enterica subsp. arizonae]SUG34742.1 S-adenosyl-L-methionine (SAM)-dependent methyltransferase PhcB [Salmonella enterica subsp. arizonae]
MTTYSHHDNIEKQFGSQANALDMGCGSGHAGFVAA